MTRPVPFSVVGFLYQEGKVLSLCRKGVLDAYSFPGGKIDPGETPRQAFVREMQEEIAITPTKFHEGYLGLEITTNTYCQLFVIEEYTGSVKSLEGPPLVWIPPYKLTQPNAPFWDYNTSALKHLGVEF